MDSALATISTTASTWSEALAASCLGETVATADRLLQRGASLAAGVIGSGMMGPAGYQRLSSSQFEKGALTPCLSHFRKFTVDARSSDFVLEIPGLVNQFKNLHTAESGPNKGLVDGDDGNPVIRFRRHVRVVLPLPASKAIDPMDMLGLTTRAEGAMLREGGMDRNTSPTPSSTNGDGDLSYLDKAYNTCLEIPSTCQGFKKTMTSSCGQAINTCGALSTLAALSALNSNWLYVMEFTIDHALYHKIHDTIKTVMGTGAKRAPAYIFGKVATAINGYIKSANRGKPTAEQYCYLNTTGQILALGFLLNTTFADGTIVKVVLTEELDPSVEEDTATAAEETPLDVDLIGEALNEIRKVCPHLSENVTPLLPATECTGDKYEAIEVIMKEDDIRAWLEVADDTTTAGQHGAVGAATVGINALGCLPPNDTKHPMTFVSGFTRHLCATSGNLAVSATDAVKYVIDKTSGAKPHSDFYEVAGAMTKADTAAFAKWLADENISAEIGATMFSASVGEEKTNAVLAEWYETAMRKGSSSKGEYSKAILAGVFCKAGENSSRGRFITMPGKNGTQDIHQACVSRPVKLIEKFMKEVQNHHHMKGLDIEGSNLAMGEWLWDMPDDHFVISFDKKANDRTWSCHHYEVWVEYVHMMMAEVARVTGNNWEFPWMNFQDESFDMNVSTAYFTACVNAVYWFLMSAVGPTSFFNRIHSEAESGVVCKNVYGADALVKWLRARSVGIASTIQDEYEGHFCNDKDNTRSECVVKLRYDGSIGSPSRFVNEGDDKAEGFQATAKLNTWEKMAKRVVTIGAEILKIALEPVLFRDPDSRCKGRRSLVEFCSRGYALELHKDDYLPKAALMCPKPLKNMQKMAWQVSQQFKYCKNKEGEVAIVQDQTFMRLCATRCLSIAEYNVCSPGVGPFILAHAQYYIEQCKQGSKVLFDDRSFEARHPEEAELGSHVDQLLSEWYTTLSQVYDQGLGRTKGALFLASNLWQIEHLSMQEMPIQNLQAHLLRFDEQTRDLPSIEAGWFLDPRPFLSLVDVSWMHKLVHHKFGILKQHMLNVTTLLPSKNTFESFISKMTEILKPGKTPAAAKAAKGPAADASANGLNGVLKVAQGGAPGLTADKKHSTHKGKNYEPAVPAPTQGVTARARKEELTDAGSSASAWAGKGTPIGAVPAQAK